MLRLNVLIILPISNITILVVFGNYKETMKVDIITMPYHVRYNEKKGESYAIKNYYSDLRN